MGWGVSKLNDAANVLNSSPCMAILIRALFCLSDTQPRRFSRTCLRTRAPAVPGPFEKVCNPAPVARSYPVLLLLLNYLLVVGAGMVERPARVIERPYNYVHSQDCQLKHTLRLACFDDCNGVQYTVKKYGERLPLTQLLTTFKGLDLHCLPESRVAFATPVFGRLVARLAAWEATVPVGYRGRIELPPRRG